MNQALAMSRGSLVCFHRSDDWFLPEKLVLQVDRFAASGSDVGVVYGRGVRYFEDTDSYVTPNAELHRGWVLRQLIERNFVYPITPMFRRECFDRFPFDESYRAEGEAIYRKLAIPNQCDYAEEVVGVMRVHSSNTGKNVEMMYDDNLRYLQEFFTRSDLPDDIRSMKGPSIAALLAQAIHTHPRLAFDIKVVAAILLSFLPIPVLAKVYRRLR